MIELLRTRRSIRRYKSEPIDERSLALLIEALLRAPSSRDFQPWEFVVVDNRELLMKLSTSKEHGSQFLKGAALGIVVCADTEKSDVWVEDCSIASILVQMTAHSLGLGSCWIQIRNRMHNKQKTSEDYIRDILGLPERLKVESIISIGHPDESKKPVPNSRLDYSKIKHNSYSELHGPVRE